MYDHPPSPLSSVAALASTKVQRSHSPKAHIAHLMPHHSCNSQYHPNTRQADISRLLDPAYASSSASSSSSTRGVIQPTRAYVDHRGDLHDPDYRDFPVLPTRHKMNLPRRSASAHSRIASSTRPDRYSTYPLVARPEWERDWATEVEDLNEDDEYDPYSPISERTPSSRRASLPPSVYAPSAFYYSEPMSTTSSPVDSLEEEDAEQSPFEDLEETPRSPSRTASRILRRMKRASSQSAVPAVDSSPDERQEKEEQPIDPSLVLPDDDNVYVALASPHRCTLRLMKFCSPSCTHTFRRQWRALSLRLRFGVFRAKRRLSISRRKPVS